jgi:hypothetical protein
MKVRFATVCDTCGTRSLEYETYYLCRYCGGDVCDVCGSDIREPDGDQGEATCVFCRATSLQYKEDQGQDIPW